MTIFFIYKEELSSELGSEVGNLFAEEGGLRCTCLMEEIVGLESPYIKAHVH